MTENKSKSPYLSPHEMSTSDWLAHGSTGYPPTRVPADEGKFRPGSPEQEAALRSAGWKPTSMDRWGIDQKKAEELAPEPESDGRWDLDLDFDPDVPGDRRRAYRKHRKAEAKKSEERVGELVEQMQARSAAGPEGRYMTDAEIEEFRKGNK